MIIATAGHVDHGKTSLIRALTGVDTDRLPEEKARGLSIDLGYAHWDLPGREIISFIDVPGHERFVRNMLAGVCGIDAFLLVVAADDGVMPQTVEHFEILRLMDVVTGVVAITKVDAVAAARVDEVAAQADRLTGGIRPLLRVSSVSRQGLDALETALRSIAVRRRASERASACFRLPIDRAFSVTGSGTVVTGTAFSGMVSRGDRCMLSPGGREVRVRALQIAGQAVERVHEGTRCAVNLSGVSVADVARGDWLIDPSIHSPTARLDVSLTLLATRSQPLDVPAKLQLHIGTAFAMARVLTDHGHAIPSGVDTFATLVLDRPVAAAARDRFVLRDHGAAHTVGGGWVIDPFPHGNRRSARTRRAVRAAMAAPAADDAFASLLALPDRAVDLRCFERAFALRSEAARALYARHAAVVLGRDRPFAIGAKRHASIERSVLDQLTASEDLAVHGTAMTSARLNRLTAADLPADCFGFLLRDLARRDLVEIANESVRRRRTSAAGPTQDHLVWERVRAHLAAAGARAPDTADLAAVLQTSPKLVAAALKRRSGGELVLIRPEVYMLRTTLADLAESAGAVARARPGGRFLVKEFRDAVGIGRARALEILEAFDRLGVTVRIGDAREMHGAYRSVLGPGSVPPQARPAPVPASTAVARRSDAFHDRARPDSKVLHLPGRRG